MLNLPGTFLQKKDKGIARWKHNTGSVYDAQTKILFCIELKKFVGRFLIQFPIGKMSDCISNNIIEGIAGQKGLVTGDEYIFKA